MSATADRSARAIQRSLFMASMLVQGFSAGIRARGREKARELREKPLVCPRTGVGCQRMCRACGRSACDSLGMHGLALRLAGDTGLGSARVAVGSTRRGATGAYSEQEEGPKVASCCWWTGNVFVPKKWPLARLFGLSASPSGHECGLAARHSSRS